MDRKTLKQYLPLKREQQKLEKKINRLIKINKARKQQVDKLLLEIEEFIEAIPDSNARQIFEMVFLEGKRQNEVGTIIGYSKGRVSQIISEHLKD